MSVPTLQLLAATCVLLVSSCLRPGLPLPGDPASWDALDAGVVGTAADDFWMVGCRDTKAEFFHHTTTWTTVTLAGDLDCAVRRLHAAGPGRVWVASAARTLRISADGKVEDHTEALGLGSAGQRTLFASSPERLWAIRDDLFVEYDGTSAKHHPVPPARAHTLTVVAGAPMVEVDPQCNEPRICEFFEPEAAPSSIYRFDGTDWRQLPFTVELDSAGTTFEPDDVWMIVKEPSLTTKAALAHFNGTHWRRVVVDMPASGVLHRLSRTPDDALSALVMGR